MKKLLSSLFVALLVFGLLSAALVIQSQSSFLPSALASGQEKRRRMIAPTRQSDVQLDRSSNLPTDEEALAALTEIQQSKATDASDTKTIKFDVAENATRFVFDDTPLFDDLKPAYGNEFITEGYIYPHGTLSIDEQGVVNGVNADGSPEFPTKVIGRWICRGWHTGEGARTVTGDWVVTHQLYNFGDKPGHQTITTDGLELVDVNVQIRRAIIGGTGSFDRARGEAVQTMLGFNKLGGVGLRYNLKVAK